MVSSMVSKWCERISQPSRILGAPSNSILNPGIRKDSQETIKNPGTQRSVFGNHPLEFLKWAARLLLEARYWVLRETHKKKKKTNPFLGGLVLKGHPKRKNKSISWGVGFKGTPKKEKQIHFLGGDFKGTPKKEKQIHFVGPPKAAHPYFGRGHSLAAICLPANSGSKPRGSPVQTQRLRVMNPWALKKGPQNEAQHLNRVTNPSPLRRLSHLPLFLKPPPSLGDVFERDSMYWDACPQQLNTMGSIGQEKLVWGFQGGYGGFERVPVGSRALRIPPGLV